MTNNRNETTVHPEKASVQKSFAPLDAPGTLYLVATPIGNLEDMTFRAIRTLKEVQLIAAEDTRQTRKLLTHFEIQNRLVSYHEHNREASGPELIRLLSEGQHIALVSDAGIPAISDPGADLVRDAVAQGIPVVPIPGANAALSGLIMSGLPTNRFLFLGFPPRDRKSLNKLLDGLERESGTLLFYESPHRLKKTLAVVAERWADRKIAIVRELTKRHEEAIRGSVAACLARIEEVPLLGECCLIIEGAGEQEGNTTDEAGQGQWWASVTLEQHVAHYENLQQSRKEAMKSVAADRGVSRRDVYQALLGEGQEE
ncbi:16S rRNA (cytidine(1402)-2'-O)-methyltransferase [Cohnella endophytica]|uniref:Ribosomal RNA small subunit methyltransferase I n=1 Tax=Cohnella endophytica TaxID=2419778 RepID=A0A494XD05_9BACL|nr:16S rRNA (cytidine(1402)-2'-O)-methyltransferase [Cohnella endophytica]RKP45463.1 16S rRNA (cytidine(1402)-2'-O)-methyltransferase [Cohnella endophytica]